MIGLFPALESRFNLNATLRLKGRKLYEGFDRSDDVNVVRPYTEVNIEQTDDLSTFSTDVFEYRLEFRYHAKDIKTKASKQWIDAMRQAFRDADIVSTEFTTCGCKMLSSRVPLLANGQYDAEVVFRLTVQNYIKVPLVGHT